MTSLILIGIAVVLLTWRRRIAQAIFDIQRPWYKQLFGHIVDLSKPWFRRLYDWAIVGMAVVALLMAYATHFGPLEL